jgi:Domain of unknown function (DUF4279)
VATNEGEAYFKLVGDFEPDVVTKEIGIEPSRTKLKGHPIPKYDSWHYSNGKVVADLIDVYEMSSKLIAVLQPKTRAISDAIKKHGLMAELQVVLWISMDEEISTPAIGFDQNTIKFLSNVGATIDVDTYRH